MQFQLTVNFVALVIAFVAAITNGETPLNVIQLLWVNLIMDALGALGEWSTPAAWQWQRVYTAPCAWTLLTHFSCAWCSAVTNFQSALSVQLIRSTLRGRPTTIPARHKGQAKAL